MSTDAPSPPPMFPFDRADQPLDPPALLGQWREAGPARRVTISGDRVAWLITRYEDIRALLIDSRLSSDPAKPGFPAVVPGRMALPGDFFALDAPEHDVLRRMLVRTFTVKNIERMRPAISRMTGELLTAMADLPRPVDLVEHFALPLPSLVLCDLFGVPRQDRAVFQRNAATITDLNATAEQMTVARHDLAGYLTRLLEIKKREPADDLFSELAVSRVAAGELTPEQAAGMGVLLLVAGHETTSSMISLSTVALLRHPDQLGRMLADPDSVPAAVEELLRYLTVAHFGLRRAALADIRIGDVTVRAGEGLILCLQSANRDPRVFRAPDDLVLDSGTRRNLAFGFGIHVCIGQTLARVELQTALPALFRRFPELRAAVPWQRLHYNYQAMIYGPHQLPVAW